MESRTFIRVANELIARIEAQRNASPTYDERDALRQEIHRAFAALQNPTLPSAYRLRDAALAAGFTIKNDVMNRLAQFENLEG